MTTEDASSRSSLAPPEKAEPREEHVKADDVQTAQQRKTEWIQFWVLCMCLFLAGFNDGTNGPLIPRLQEYYRLGYTVVSTLFLASCVGFMIGAFASLWLNDKIGFGKALVLGATCQAVSYAVMAPAPPFAVLVSISLLNGIGMAVQDAMSNGFVAVMKHNPERKMGVLHAVYGLGALVGPLISTQFAQMERTWSYHYIISCGLSATTAITLAVVFKFKRQEELLAEAGVLDPTLDNPEGPKGAGKYKEMFSLVLLHYFAFFILLYVGVELTIGGWLTTFIIRERGGGPESGYITTGFYAGLMLGRVVLLPVNEWMGEKTAVVVYSVMTVGLDIIVWQLRSLIGDAVAASFIGLVLGPLYPIVMNQATLYLPRHLLTGSIGWIAGFGQVGSAAFPFITGALASHFGIGVMPPVVLAMVAVMLALWILALIHVRRRRSDTITSTSTTAGLSAKA